MRGPRYDNSVCCPALLKILGEARTPPADCKSVSAIAFIGDRSNCALMTNKFDGMRRGNTIGAGEIATVAKQGNGRPAEWPFRRPLNGLPGRGLWVNLPAGRSSVNTRTRNPRFRRGKMVRV